MTELDLSPWRTSEELLDALEVARQQNLQELRDDVVKLLDHEVPIVREEAMSLLLVTWKDRSARGAALEALQADGEDFGVRTRAAMAVAATSTQSTAQQDTRVLLDRVLDIREDPDIRRAAYEGLLLMHRRRIPPLNRAFNVDADADQEWLAELQASVSSP